MRQLAESLEQGQLSLVRNDTEAIARGAAHQAELCRQWSRLESELKLRLQTNSNRADRGQESSDNPRFVELQAEWQALSSRIQHLARVHWSLLRYLDRSMAVLQRVIQSCAPTYQPGPNLLRPEELRLRAGE